MNNSDAKCSNKRCEGGKVWIGYGFTPCPECNRKGEPKLEPREKPKGAQS